MFLYPKSKHRRALSPTVFKRYRTYKRYLQSEYSRLCVYCRQPDSSAPNLNFGADHYRPKSIPRFDKLICSYANLFYCCGACNSRKTDYWPPDEKLGPYVVNPDDYEMASHLWFDAATGRVEYRSAHGKHTQELLQLNEPATVQYRLNALLTVRILRAEIEAVRNDIARVNKVFQKGAISLFDRDKAVAELQEEVSAVTLALNAQIGLSPLPPLKKQKFGIKLTTP